MFITDTKYKTGEINTQTIAHTSRMSSVKGQTACGGHVVSATTPSGRCAAEAATDSE